MEVHGDVAAESVEEPDRKLRGLRSGARRARALGLLVDGDRVVRPLDVAVLLAQVEVENVAVLLSVEISPGRLLKP